MARLVCAFCSQPEEAVHHLVRGPKGIAICDSCIEIAADAAREDLDFAGDAFLTNIGVLATNDRYVDGVLGEIADAAVAIKDGTVRWAGPERSLPGKYRDLPVLDCEGRIVLPGFTDAATAAASDSRWTRMIREGTTTAAIRSNPLPGLATDLPNAPLALGSLLRSLPTVEWPVPWQTVGRPGDGPADWIDLCGVADPVAAFESAEPLDPRGYIVANLAGELPSALGYLHRATIFQPSHRRAHGPADRLWAELPLALSTGGSPATDHNDSMQLAIWLAVRNHRLTIEEAVWSATRGAAIALDWGERGLLVRGAPGDVVILDTDKLDDLVADPAHSLVWKVFRSGILVH